MTWSETERYRQLVQEYERKLGEFKGFEAGYRSAMAKAEQPDPILVKQYEELATMRRDLESTHHQLREMREQLAHAREEASESFAL